MSFRPSSADRPPTGRPALRLPRWPRYLVPVVAALVAFGLPALGLYAWLARRARRPLIRIADLAQRRYLAGLAVFGLCYLLLGANNLVLPVLLQRAMGLPLELVGRFLGLGALAGVASWSLALFVAGPDDYRANGTTRWEAYDAQGLTVTAVAIGLVVAVVALALVVWPRRRFYPLLGLAGIGAAVLIFCAYFANSLN